MNHDAFAHGSGLSKQAYELLDALEQPKTLDELVEATGCKRETARRLLRTMAREPHALVRKNVEVWTRCPDSELLDHLDQFAFIRGTRGRSRTQARQYAVEREGWDARRARTPAPPRRTLPGQGWYDPAEDIYWEVGSEIEVKGVEGRVGPLVLSFTYNSGKRHLLSVAGEVGYSHEVQWIDSTATMNS